jgi:hypothetical protein
MLSAKEGSRTPTRVTPPEPEGGVLAQVAGSSDVGDTLKGAENTLSTPGSWGPPTIPEAAKHLARLRSDWDALDEYMAGELLGEGDDT